jgi:hypothetical protein
MNHPNAAIKLSDSEPITFAFQAFPDGDDGTRTRDIRLAKAALSQLSYIPFATTRVVGLTGFEPVTPALSAQCSNQLSYKPIQSSALAAEE